jgi:hypothetical protein
MRSKRGHLKLPSTPIWLTAAALALLWPRPAVAQTSQVLPEVDTYLELDPSTRISFQVKATREGGVPIQAEIGPSLDFYIKSLPTLLRITTFAPDDSKGQLLVLSIGYRYLPEASGAPATNRIEPVATFQVPMKGALLLSDRNRAAIDSRLSGPSQLGLSISHPTPALRSSTKANTRSGARPNSLRAFPFPWGAKLSSARIMNTRTIPARLPIDR